MVKQLLATSVFAAGVLLAGAAMASTQSMPMQHPAMHVANAGNMYTSALNTLYANGYHGVHHLWIRSGTVHASAVTAMGKRETVTVQPGSDSVQAG